MANAENLKALSSKKAREIGRKGGLASGKAKREKKLIRETLETLLAMPLDDKKIEELEKIPNVKSLKGRNVTVQDAIMIAMAQKAMKGDIRAAEYIRDSVGQKPTNEMSLDLQVPVFYEGENDLTE